MFLADQAPTNIREQVLPYLTRRRKTGDTRISSAYSVGHTLLHVAGLCGARKFPSDGVRFTFSLRVSFAFLHVAGPRCTGELLRIGILFASQRGCTAGESE